MLEMEIIQVEPANMTGNQEAAPQGVNSLKVSAKPSKVLANKLMRMNGIWEATNKSGELLRTNDFITAYLFCRDCGYGLSAISEYEKLRKI